MIPTVITAPSTINLKSIAPTHQVAATPNRFIMLTAKSMESGMTEATTKPALRFPTAIQGLRNDNQSAFKQVSLYCSHRLRPTSSVQSIKGSMTTPSGRLFLLHHPFFNVGYHLREFRLQHQRDACHHFAFAVAGYGSSVLLPESHFFGYISNQDGVPLVFLITNPFDVDKVFTKPMPWIQL